jgi:hypothetical protein
MIRRLAMVILLLLGLIGVVVFGWFAVQDWAALCKAYGRFQHLSAAHADLRTLFAADAVQNNHRINLFAEGVWALLSAILAGIGLHGWVLLAERDGKPQ